jgi:septum site-determining protein MinC
MKAKQKNIRIFELEVEEESHFFEYMEKNIVLLKDYFLLINGTLTPKMRSYLEEQGTCFKEADSCKLKLSTKSKTPQTRDIIEQKSEKSTQEVVKYVEVQEESPVDEKHKTLLFEKPIRSGEEVVHSGDITIFGRVNSAAKVLCEGNVEVYGCIDGLVQCDGEYMIAKEIGKGYVVFNGDILEKEFFDGNLKKITRSDEGAVIKDIF